jgi:hypothetical protein
MNDNCVAKSLTAMSAKPEDDLKQQSELRSSENGHIKNSDINEIELEPKAGEDTRSNEQPNETTTETNISSGTDMCTRSRMSSRRWSGCYACQQLAKI